jgi:hypothetical protein
VGTAGLNRSTWYQWTATPNGIMQWYTPAGALNQWTWAPIAAPSGRRMYAVGVFEVEYLYTHPTYAWEFSRSQPNGGAAGTYCSYRWRDPVGPWEQIGPFWANNLPESLTQRTARPTRRSG